MNTFYRFNTIRIINHFPLMVSLAIMSVFVSPFILQGTSVVLPWIDNMDSYLVWNKLAAEYVGFFESSTTPIPPFMNGLPMYGVAGGFSIFFFLNKLFSAFIATALYYFMLHTTAVVGMYWLTNKFIAPQKKWLAAAAALAFGLQGFLPAWGLGIAGAPMMIAVYLRNRTNGFEWFMYLLIIFYAYSSNVQSAGIFTIVAGIIAASLQSLSEKKIQWRLYAPSLFLMFVFTLLRGELFYQLLSGEGYESHRAAFSHPIPKDNGHVFFTMWRALKNPLGILLSSGVFPFIMVVSLFPLLVWKKTENNQRHLIILLFSLLLLLGAYAGIIQTTGFISWRNSVPFFKMYSLERPLILVDIIWYILFAFSLLYIAKSKWGAIAITAIMFAQTALHFYHTTWWKAIFGLKEKYQSMAYADYYSEELFGNIKNDIGIEPALYKVAAFGIHPAVLQHNGFYTTDGYCSNYPLAYKNEFRKIIAAELPAIVAKQNSSINGFDNWGHKLYLQTSSMFEIAQTGPPITKQHSTIVPTPKWNIEAMRQLQTTYVISGVEIAHPEEVSLQLQQHYENNTYTIFLYAVLPISNKKQ